MRWFQFIYFVTTVFVTFLLFPCRLPLCNNVAKVCRKHGLFALVYDRRLLLAGKMGQGCQDAWPNLE